MVFIFVIIHYLDIDNKKEKYATKTTLKVKLNKFNF